MNPIKIYISLFASCLFFSLGAIDNPDSVFQEANQLYQEGNYEEAANLYARLDSLGLRSSEVYFNAGNACFRSNKLGMARLYYERALLMDPADKDIQSNLEYLESLLTDRLDDVPVFFLRKWINKLLNIFNPDTWAILAIVFFFLFFSGMMIYIFVKPVNLRKTGFFLGLIFLLLSTASLLSGRRNAARIENPGTAVMMEGSMVVRSAPRLSGKELFILHEGTRVWLENGLDGWIEIRISDGRKGWVPEKSLEKI